MPSIDIPALLDRGDAESVEAAVNRFFAEGGTEADLVAEMNRISGDGSDWDMISRYAFMLWARLSDLSQLKVPVASILASRGLMEDFKLAVSKGADLNISMAYPPALIGVISRWSGSTKRGEVKRSRADALELVRMLLEKGADPNKSGQWITALGQAAECKDLEVVELLLAHGADPRQRDSARYTALHMAMRGLADADLDSFLGVIDRLVAAGADINAVDDDGRTPLGALADVIYPENMSVDGYRRVMEHLMDLGARPLGDAATSKLLHRAAARGVGSLCEVLIQMGADVDALDGDGRTFVDVAKLEFRREAASLMVQGRIAKAMPEDGAVPAPSSPSRGPGVL